MIRDPGPVYNLGYGVNSRTVPRWEGTEEQRGDNPESSIVSKALDKHPVMRFLAVSAATMVGAAVAGKVVREGGVKLFSKLQDVEKPWATQAISDVRKVRDYLDSLSGVERAFHGEAPDADKLYGVLDGRPDPGKTHFSRTWFTTNAEREEAIRTGTPPPSMWHMKDSLQQSLVSQARRMPYELPAAYITQRAIIDPIMGSNEDNNVNWWNPVDVVSDFVDQSVKNTFGMMLPFEAGSAAAKQGWRRFFTYGDDATQLLTKSEQNVRTASLTMKAVLGQVGADFTNIFNKTLNVSSRSTGAVAAGLTEARQGSTSLTEYLHDVRNTKGFANMSATQRAKTYLQNPGLLDIIPGPFSGAGTGVRAAGRKYREMAASQNAYTSMMNMGYQRFEQELGKDAISMARTGVFKQLEDAGILKARKAPFNSQMEALQAQLGQGGHAIGELGRRIGGMARGGPILPNGKPNPAFKYGSFHRDLVQNEYSKEIARQLEKKGVAKAQAWQFATDVRISTPTHGEVERNIMGRVSFGKDPVMGRNEAEFMAGLGKRIESHYGGKFGMDSISTIRRELKSAIRNADDRFLDESFRKVLDRKIANQWGRVESDVLPTFGASLVKQSAQPYEKFTGALSREQERFMRRKTAQLTGMRMVGEHGAPVSDAAVFEHLGRARIDPNNTAWMRGFLSEKGALSKPWNRDGRNIFGLKKLTVDAALERGIFRSGQYDDRDVRALVGRMAANDPISTVGSFALGGAWESNIGTVLDTGILRRGLNRTLNTLATDYHIPLIKMNPLELFGYSARQELRDRSLFKLVPSMSNQAFLKGANPQDDFYMWMRQGTRGTKGRVLSMGYNQGGAIVNELPGLYRPHSAIGGFMARHARLAIKDQGHIPENQELGKLGRGFDRLFGEGSSQKFKQRMSVSDHQQDSLFGWVDRFRKRKGDLNNPVTFARLLRDGQVETRKGVTTLKDVMDDPARFGGATDGFFSWLRRANFAPRVVRGLEKEGSTFGGLFEVDLTGVPTTTVRSGRIKLNELKTPQQWEEVARKTLADDLRRIDKEGITGARASALRRAQGMVRGHIDEAYGASYWDRTPSQAKQAGLSTHSRIESLQSDFLKYLTVRRGVMQYGDFNQEVPDLLAQLTKMRSAGQITTAEATEARAAILSLQYDIFSFQNYKPDANPFDLLRQNVTALRNTVKTGGAGTVLDDIAEGRLGVSDSKTARFQPFFRRHLTASQYQYQGAERNPFASDTVFIPTFGTTFARDPRAAVASVLGFNTWSNPDAFSGVSSISSHLVERMNRYFTAAGMGLDPTAFKGPLDMYARGFIGKRALPIVAGGTALLAADRTLGGYMNEKDEYGQRVYSPYVLGKGADAVVKAQAGLAGLLPGGKSYEESLNDARTGETAVRSGRWWPLGNTPWKGGRIQYYRPNWYQRLKSGHMYTDQTYGSPLERLAFGYDFSPLRPLDPYRFEREHYNDRPYPVTGPYFTGPWGPLTSALNMTVGRILKPTVKMHEQEVQQGLAQYAPVGDWGAYVPPSQNVSLVSVGSGGGGYGGGSGVIAARNIGSGSAALVAFGGRGGGGQFGSSGGAGGFLTASNNRLAAAGATSPATAANSVVQSISSINQQYASAAYSPAYGTVKEPGLMDPRIISAAPPISGGGVKFQASQFGYELQELTGIYGFAFGSVRSALGYGNQNLSPDKPVLATAGKAYGSNRGFWDLNLGGIGDVPLPLEGSMSNLEFSEIVRRFIPRDRTDVQYLNPIQNDLGILHPWLPGSDYHINFKQGDPYTAIQEGEMRLPGAGYDRLHKLHSDRTGKYGVVDRLKILGDVAPWSQEYRQMNMMIDSIPLSASERAVVETTRAQVAAKAQENEFTPYKYKYMGREAFNQGPLEFAAGRLWEHFSHSDSYFNTKFWRNRTAVEDWERDNVYGATFPEWQHPIEDFLKPTVYKATQRGPFAGASSLGVLGTLFGASPQAKMVAGFIGGSTGLAAGAYGETYEAVTGRQWIPMKRKKEVALEEYTDILTYVKNMHLATAAKASGNQELATQFLDQAKQTMYGADIYQGDLGQIALAIPKRKREHFKAMLSAPTEERQKILQSAGRLERRIYEAAWGMPVEERPDLEEYFRDHELPEPGWEGWNPSTSMDQMKIKVGQSLGIDLSEMGYYPQQIREANLVNMSYPDFTSGTGRFSTASRLRQLMNARNINADIIPVVTPYAGERINIQSGAW